jgi:ATP-dependent RNA helicase DDX51/DBP6
MSSASDAPGALATLAALRPGGGAVIRGAKRARVSDVKPRSSSDTTAHPRVAATFTALGALVTSLLPQLGKQSGIETSSLFTETIGDESTPLQSIKPPPMAEDAARWGLNEGIVRALAADGVTHFFPIQRAVIPALLVADAAVDATVGDASISAPTGAGKTIAFALPVLQSLLAARRAGDSGGSGGAPRRRALHALVVLPTRDLALQVYGVMSRYAAAASEGSTDPIRVAAAIGQAPFAAEQIAIIAGGEGVDILVASPGRLAEHLDATPALAAALTGLRVLVVDEADRLLASSYQDWVRRVNHAVFGARDPLAGDSITRLLEQWPAPPQSATLPSVPWAANFAQPWRGESSRVGCVFTPQPCAPLAVANINPTPTSLTLPTWLSGDGSGDSIAKIVRNTLPEPAMLPTYFRRIVCSATMTANPQKLAALGLRFPTYFSATSVMTSQGAPTLEPATERASDGKRLYTMPPSVHHAMVVCSAEEKPVALSRLLRVLEGEGGAGLRALVFTNSVETAHRLTRLLQLLGGLSGRVVEFTATLSQSARSAVLEAAAAGVVSVLVASDAAARGLDLVALPAVIHYDAPTRVKAYVHRVGRTARAGAVGVSYAIVRPEQARHFRLLAARTRGAATSTDDISGLRIETLPHAEVTEVLPRLTAALEALKGVLEAEKNGELLVSKAVKPIDKSARGSGDLVTAAAHLGEEEDE